MFFLLLRFLPYIIPVAFFVAVKAVFGFSDYWLWFLASIVILPLTFFLLLRRENIAKPVFWLAVYAIVYAVTGFAYVMILENSTIISLFAIIWSLIYWLYLEAVFHDFYDTKKTYILNLRNITLYGNILIIFFATATLVSFNIFLNLSWVYLLLIAIVSYFSILYLTFQRLGLNKRQTLIYAGLTNLILSEVLAGLLLLPSSFYIIAIIVSLCYYLLTQTVFYALEKRLNRKTFIQLLAFFSIILLAVIITATWL